MKGEHIKYKILVVDDEGIIAMDLQQKLRRLDYEVPAIAHSAEQAIVKVDELRPDLVLLDINMGGAMDGIDAAHKIREQFGTPVIFLTAYADHHTVQRAKLTEPFGYIVKPFNETELRIAVEIAIYKSEAQQLLQRRAMQQEAIAEFGQLALSGLPLRGLMEDAVARIARILNADCCGLFELQTDGNALLLQAGVGWRAGQVGMATVASGPESSEAGYTLASRLLITEDLRTETRFEPSPLLLEQGIVSGICVVIYGLERPYGVLGAFSRSERAFSAEDANFLQPMANVISQVNERYYAEERLQSARNDIAERQRVEQERMELLRREQAARREAEDANRAKDEFLAVVSHELRTPLNNIMGWASLLVTGKLDDATASQAMQTIERNTRLQVQLIEDILDVSRIISGKLYTKLAPLRLASVITAAVESVRPAATNKGVHIDLRLETKVGEISGDANRLQQVIWNLLTNSIKFTPQGGVIEVRLERKRTMAQITVRDTGMGIKPEFLPHVFERFRQADSSNTREYGGLGLGLAIVQHLVEIHGGTVSVYSAGQNKGTTVIVQLPLLVRPQTPPAAEEKYPPASQEQLGSAANPETGPDSFPLPAVLEGLRVLVVDDEADTCAVLTKMLELAGARVQGAASAAAALKLLQSPQESWPHVLISDIAMPGDDGYSLIHEVRVLETARDDYLPAIALTAHVRPKDRALALSAGFQCHLVKPVPPDVLVSAVARLTGRAVSSESTTPNKGEEGGSEVNETVTL